ncbi:MAG: PatB family C-S lyase [Methylobacillus sp.]|nr:PatB family C-S lyase [Methylobacillus sp.]
MSFDFDREISRLDSHALKYTARLSMFGDKDVQPMWVADMDFAAPKVVTNALIERARHPIYGYTQTPESVYESLVDWMRERHGWAIQREWIVLTPGVVPSINMSVLALTQPGDGVIAQPPVYAPLFSAATKTNRTLILNPLRFDGQRYAIDFEHLESCAAKAKMLLLCSPHNPVGRVWREDELKQLLAIARRHNLTIISDEIHADLVYPEFHHHTLASLADNAADIITAVAPSKTFNIPGLGLSALIVPDAERRQAIMKILDMIHVNTANPFSLTAFEAAYRAGAPWLEALLVYLHETRDEAARFIAQHLPRIRLIAPEATFLLWLDCRDLGMNDAALKHFMAHDARLGLSPGSQFGAQGAGFMRMNIAAPRRAVMDALQRLSAAISN